jgi:hypothetical protein
MGSTCVVGGTLRACAEREGRALVVEVLWVREASFVLAFHIIPFHISLTKPLWIASTLIGAGSASGECEHEQDAKKAFQREWSAVVTHVETIEIILRQHNFLAGC